MSEKLEIIIGAQNKFGPTFKSLGISVAAAGAAIIGLAGTSIKAFAKYEESLTDMGKVTKESFDSINQKIMAISPTLGSSTQLC